ncbi:MAG: hypothetical protein U0350_41550 [Caldilineaceae bacterium]
MLRAIAYPSILKERAIGTKQREQLNQWLLVLAFTVAALPQVYKLYLPVQEIFSGFIPDDALYYYKTALNIRMGWGPTFDTVNVTNGYHPLWMLICVLLSFITTHIYAYLYLVLCVNLALALLFSWQIFELFRPRLGMNFALLLVGLLNWNFWSAKIIFSGLETPLYLCLFLLSLSHLLSLSPTQPKALALLGLWWGLTFLARTEFILLLPVFVLYLYSQLYRQRPVAWLKLTGYWGLPFALLTLPYLAYNYLLMGHLQQISGLVKNLVGLYHWQGGVWHLGLLAAKNLLAPLALAPVYLLVQSERTYLLVNALPALLLVSGLVIGWRKARQQDWPLALLLICGGISTVYYFVEFGEPAYWHLAIMCIATQILFVYAIKALYAQAPIARRFAVALLIGLLWLIYGLQTPTYAYLFRSTNFHFIAPVYYQHEIAIWIKANLPPDSTIGVWNAGYVGYFSEHKVVNLDGLMNGKALYEALKNSHNYTKESPGVYQFIRDQQLDYISDYYFGEPGPPHSPLAADLTLVHTVGPQQVMLNGKALDVDWYIWKVRHSGR